MDMRRLSLLLPIALTAAVPVQSRETDSGRPALAAFEINAWGMGERFRWQVGGSGNGTLTEYDPPHGADRARRVTRFQLDRAQLTELHRLARALRSVRVDSERCRTDQPQMILQISGASTNTDLGCEGIGTARRAELMRQMIALLHSAGDARRR